MYGEFNEFDYTLVEDKVNKNAEFCNIEVDYQMRLIMFDYKESLLTKLDEQYPITDNEEANIKNNFLKQQKIDELNDISDKVKNLFRNNISNC